MRVVVHLSRLVDIQLVHVNSNVQVNVTQIFFIFFFFLLFIQTGRRGWSGCAVLVNIANCYFLLSKLFLFFLSCADGLPDGAIPLLQEDLMQELVL